MRVLFAGFGDIARRAAGRFLAAGWQVTGVRRTPGDVPGVDTVTGDCRDRELMTGLVAAHDLVVVSLTPDSYTEEGYQQAYVVPALTLRDAIRQAEKRPRLVLWVSSTSVYGPGDGGWVDETTSTEPGGFSGRALLEAEKAIAQAPAPATVIRFTGIYGSGRGRMIRQVLNGDCAPAAPVKWTNRIHAEDCAGVIHHLAARFFAGDELAPLYIGTDNEPVPLHDVHAWLAAQLGVEFREGEAKKSRGNRRCSNARLLSTGYEFIYPTYREGYRAVLEQWKGEESD